jgi:hypothetical protein
MDIAPVGSGIGARFDVMEKKVDAAEDWNAR